jgi:hypothetical protein
MLGDESLPTTLHQLMIITIGFTAHIEPKVSFYKNDLIESEGIFLWYRPADLVNPSQNLSNHEFSLVLAIFWVVRFTSTVLHLVLA